MKQRCLLFVLVLVCLGAADRSYAQQAGQKPLVLRGGLLIDGTGKDALKDPVVVISGGKIQSVGTEGSVTVPADATVINTAGKTIIPGLVDSHIHYRNLLAPWFLYWGVTTVGDMANPRGWIFGQKEAVEKGRFIGPYVMAVGSMLNAPRRRPQDPTGPGELAGTRTFLNGNGYQAIVSDEASIEAAIADAKKRGADAVKLYIRMNPAVMKVAARIGHQQGLPVFSHYTSAEARNGLFQGMDEILDTGIDLNVHLFGLVKAAAPPDIRDRIAKGESVEAWHDLDPAKLSALAQGLAEKKIYLNPTLGAEFGRSSRHLEEFDRFSTQFLQGPMGKIMPANALPRYVANYKHAEEEKEEEIAELREGFHKAGEFVKEFVAHGGKVIAGADTGPGTAPAGVSLHVEMQLLEEAGLSRMQALQAATSWAMEAWGKSKEVGTIEPGKRADLVVLNRNPLEDITATRDISQVIQGGKVVDREALANWKDTWPRPTPNANPMIQIPLITDMSPDSFPVNTRNASEVILRGENFTAQSKVLFNDRVLPAKFYSENRLGVSLPADVLKEAGVFPVLVVRPGSAGGASNLFYFAVTSN